jgi:integrase/recombinase XerD
MTPLRQRMIEDMKLRNLSPRTIEAYVMRAASFARYFGRSPAALGREEVRTYLLHLVQKKKVSWSVYNQTVAALKFLYEVTLNREGVMVRVRCPKQPKKLPTVLSLDETARFFAAILSIKHRAILMTAYAAGLRLSEVVGLRIEDIDSQRMVIRVRQGKGRKDRNVMLSPRLLALLREYWKAAKPTDWLFPGDIPGQPITDGSVHRICVQAARAAGLGKHVTPRASAH